MTFDLRNVEWGAVAWAAGWLWHDRRIAL